MSNEIVLFGEEHLEDAARLFADSFIAERRHVPLLPGRFEDPAVILPRLVDLSGRVPGVAAVRGGKLVAYMLGRRLASWSGRRSVWVPEWAHAESGEGRGRLFHDMYARLAPEWVRNGCFTHLFSTLAHDAEINEALSWLGFGMVAADGVRDLGAVAGPLADVAVRRAGVDDADIVRSLDEAHERYMATSPIFMAFENLPGREDCRERLAAADTAVWLASYQGEVVARLRIGPAFREAAYIVVDDGTASITAAFTRADVRGRGINARLLQHALTWARDAGYERCAVDFEPENLLARSFWLAHFQAVSYSFGRCLDARIAWAHYGRGTECFW